MGRRLCLILILLVLPAGQSWAQTTLRDSGPVAATRDGQVIENLRITSTRGDGITVNGRDDVVIRNVEILHAGGAGIWVQDADRLLIENVSITHTGAPPFGENPNSDRNNIHVYRSSNLTVRRAKLVRGSTGIYLDRSPDAKISMVEGHDFRGLFPRGQLVQFGEGSHRGLIEDFSVECPRETSFTEDNINVFHSSDIVVRRGLIDGNNSHSGVGVIAEQAKGYTSGLLVEDVDAVRMGNGCFSASPGFDVTFRRTRCKSNICEAQNRRMADGSIDTVRGGRPLSNALGWAAGMNSQNVRILDSVYADWCNYNLVWPRSNFETVELREQDFTLRSPIRLTFPWEPGHTGEPTERPRPPILLP